MLRRTNFPLEVKLAWFMCTPLGFSYTFPTDRSVNTGIVIEWTWRWYVYYYIHKGRNLLSVVVHLTCPEIGKSMVSRVNNDVTFGLCLS